MPPGGGDRDGTFHQRLAGRVFFCAAPMAPSVQRQTYGPQMNQRVPKLKPLAVSFPPFFSFLLFFLPSPFLSFFPFSRWVWQLGRNRHFGRASCHPWGSFLDIFFRQPYKRAKAKRTANSCARLLGLTMMPRPPSAQN